MSRVIAFVHRVLYRDLLLPGDTYLIQIRKMFIAAYAPVSIFPLMHLFLLLSQQRQAEIYVPGAVIRHTVLILALVCSWVYVRVTRPP